MTVATVMTMVMTMVVVSEAALREAAEVMSVSEAALREAEEVAAAVRFLACAGAGYITGSVLKIDGGIF